jgi:hypothetical protein
VDHSDGPVHRQHPRSRLGGVWAAAERGDYFGFGAEAMNAYALGRRLRDREGQASFAFNRGVGLLGRLGNTGATGSSTDGRRRERSAPEGGIHRPSRRILLWRQWSARLPWAATRGNRIPPIYESAFTPGLRDIFLAPSWVGGIEGATAFSRLRFSIDYALKGNLALRTLVHEGWHVRQMGLMSQAAFEQVRPYLSDPTEWTQPGSTARGAWNVEMDAPAGSFPRAVAAFQWFLER